MSAWVGPDLSPLVVHRHTDDLSDVRRWLVRRAETEMVQDPADRDGVGDVAHDRERATAAFADERIRLKDLALSSGGGFRLRREVDSLHPRRSLKTQAGAEDAFR